MNQSQSEGMDFNIRIKQFSIVDTVGIIKKQARRGQGGKAQSSSGQTSGLRELLFSFTRGSTIRSLLQNDGRAEAKQRGNQSPYYLLNPTLGSLLVYVQINI